MSKLTLERYVAKYYRDCTHVYEVKKLSLMLFDCVNETIRNIPLKYRKILEIAAILHDIGYNKNSKNHNKHAYEIITKTGLEGFDEKETELIALIARYHRGAMPDKKKHQDYGQLDKKERKIVKRLSAILRLCDGLDRAHMQLIKALKTDYDEKNNIFTIFLLSNIPERTPDITSAIKKKDLFEKVYKVQVVFKFVQY